MSLPDPGNRQSPGRSCSFTTTRWSVVLGARDGDVPEADAALEELCRAYWWPLYAFARRRGHGPEDAQDLVQGFFARMLEKDYLRSVDRTKGRFRSFLLTAFEHFERNQWRRDHTQKRGGEFRFVSIDDEATELAYGQLQGSQLTPEGLYDQQWSVTLLGRVLERLKEKENAEGNGERFEELKVFLQGERPGLRIAELAARLGTTEGALKMAKRRLMDRYEELLREEVAATVSRPEEIEDEIHALLVALGGM